MLTSKSRLLARHFNVTLSLSFISMLLRLSSTMTGLSTTVTRTVPSVFVLPSLAIHLYRPVSLWLTFGKIKVEVSPFADFRVVKLSAES